MPFAKKTIIATAASTCLLVGCAESEVKTYRVAKEAKPAIPAPSMDGHAHGMGGGQSMPHVHGKTPAGWEERAPERMRVASFEIPGEGGQKAAMALIPMPGTSGIELQSINMWRQELGLPDFTADEFKAEAKSIGIGSDLKGQLFELHGAQPRPGEDFKRSTLGVVFDRNGMLWFAKLTGESSVVAKHKESFQSYLQSLEFHDEAHGSAPVAAATADEPPAQATMAQAQTGGSSAPAGSPKWTPPGNWKQKTPGPMLTAAYNIEGDGQAEVTISQLSGEGGGMVPNINRWRGQLGLGPASESEIQQSVTYFDVSGRKAYVADLKGTNVRTGKAARMIAVGVPAGGQTWFYKLMGDEALVGKEKDALVKFITAAH